MKDNNLNLFNKIIIATVLLLLIVVVYYRQQTHEDTDGDDLTEVTVAPKPPEAKPGEDNSVMPAIPYKEVPKQVATERYKKSIGFDDAKYNSIVKQHILVKEFKNKIKLDVKLPANMNFVNMDMEDDIAGLYGMSKDGQKEMAILAREGKVDVKDVIKYLQESAKAFPLLDGHELQADKISVMKAPESTGFSNIKIIPTTDRGDKATYGALMERKDGKGTYLFMMEAPRDYFDNSEGSLDLMLESAKAKP